MGTSTMLPTSAHPMATRGRSGLLAESSSGQAHGFMVLAGSTATLITGTTRIMATTVLFQIMESKLSIIFTPMKPTMGMALLETLATTAVENTAADSRAEDIRAVAVVTKAAVTTRTCLPEGSLLQRALVSKISRSPRCAATT
jgi:hypothetical protein